MSNDATLGSQADGELEAEGRADADIEAQLELLVEENRRLREQSRRLRQNQYRRTALGLFVLGLFAGAGAALFPPVRDVLIALAGIGLFSAVLIYFLTPERFLAASIGESVYSAHARSVEELIADLGLEDIYVYVPIGGQGTRLFVPQHADYRIPSEDDLDSALVVPDDERTRGVSLHPTGGDLSAEFERTVSGDLAEEPTELGQQLTDGLVEAFELVDSANVSPASAVDEDNESQLPGPEGNGTEGRITIDVTGNVYGDGASVDHPVTSVVACSLARQLATPIIADVIPSSDADIDYHVTCRWPTPIPE